MRFTTDAKTLKAALRTVKGAVESRITMPILACVRIEVAGSRSTMSATDLEVGLTVGIGVTTQHRKGVTVVPFKALAAAIKPLKHQVTIETNKEYLEVSDGQYLVSLATHPADEYPTLPEQPEGGELQSLEGLRLAIDLVAHAASADETRYNLNGIAIDADSGHCIATDGHRLAIADASSVKLPWKGIQILPLKPALMLAKLLKGLSDRVRVTSDGKAMMFQGEGFALGIRCIDGDYPNYQQVIPRRVAETIKVDRDALLDGLALVEHCAPERSRAVKITMDAGIGLATSNSDSGSAAAHVDAVRGRGKADVVKTLGLNGRYLRDALKAIDPGEIRIGMPGSNDNGKSPDYTCSPIKIQGPEEFPLCVVMPMRL